MDNPRIPRIKVPKKGIIPVPAINLAREKYEEAGILILDGILPVSYIDQLREAFLADYERQVRRKEQRFASEVGDKRVMLSVDVEDCLTSNVCLRPICLSGLMPAVEQ